MNKVSFNLQKTAAQ